MKFRSMGRMLTMAITLALVPTFASAVEEGKFVIAFRMVKPKTMEFEDAKKGNDFIAALKKIGCVVKPEDHAGHIDVTYQQPKWSELTLGSDELVHQWQGWLVKAGFETLHADGADDGHDHEHGDAKGEGHDHEHGEILKFQAKEWIVKHFENESDAKEFVAIGKGLGCEIKQDIHDGHADVQLRSLEIRHLDCRSHDEAEARVKWLQGFGFNAKHED